MSLSFHLLHAKPNNKAILVLHGLTGAPFEMKKYGKFLYEGGYDVYGECLPGHGDDRDRIYTIKYTEWIDFVCKKFEELSSKYDEVFVSGLCLGAVLSLAVASKYKEKVKGVIALSTTLYLDGWSLPWYSCLMPLGLSTIFRYYYTYPQCEPYGVKNPRTRKAVQKAFSNTEVGMDNYPMCAFQELLNLSTYMRDKFHNVVSPALIIHSKEDDLTSPKGAREVYQKISSEDKELIILDNSYHMVVYDNDKQFVFQKSLDFLNSHSKVLEVV